MELAWAARKAFHQILQDFKTLFPVHILQLVHVVTCWTKAVVLEDGVRPRVGLEAARAVFEVGSSVRDVATCDVASAKVARLVEAYLLH